MNASFYSSEQSPLFQDSHCHFLLSTKDTQTLHGKSLAPYSSLNLAYHVGDNRESVFYNRQILIENFYPNKRLLYINQIHSNILAMVSYDEVSQEIIANFHTFDTKSKLSSHLDSRAIQGDSLESNIESKETLLGNADGIICDNARFVAMIMVADCNPILLFSPKQEVFALLHAGRQGTCNLIVTHALQLLEQHYGVQPQDIRAFIGASIRQCCYEIGADLAGQIQRDFGKQYLAFSNQRYRFDMIKLLVDEFRGLGINENHIEILPICSCCNYDYFSYRREGTTGRFGLFASLLEKRNIAL